MDTETDYCEVCEEAPATETVILTSSVTAHVCAQCAVCGVEDGVCARATVCIQLPDGRYLGALVLGPDAELGPVGPGHVYPYRDVEEAELALPFAPEGSRIVRLWWDGNAYHTEVVPQSDDDDR